MMVATFPTREDRVPVPGGDVWYQVIGEGGGAPLVAVAGGPGCAHDYFEPLYGLADERPVVVYDQLGAGRSDTPDDAGLWNHARFVDELSRVIEASGREAVHLLGHSSGTIFASAYALQYPTRLRSLILAGPVLSTERYLGGLAALRAELSADAQAALERHIASGSMDGDDFRAAMAEFFDRHFYRRGEWPETLARTVGPTMNVAAYTTMWGPSEFLATGSYRDFDITGQLTEISIPTLFTCGRHDLTRPEETAWYQSLVPGAELVVFEQSSHMPHLEEPARYLEVVRGFLRGVEAE